MPSTVLNTVPRIRAYCYLCFVVAIIILWDKLPKRKTHWHKSAGCLVVYAHVNWKVSCGGVLVILAEISYVSMTGWVIWADLILLYSISLAPTV